MNFFNSQIFFLISFRLLQEQNNVQIRFQHCFSPRKQVNSGLVNNAIVSSILTFGLKDLDPDSVQKSKRFPKDFQVEIKFRQMCKCTPSTPFPDKCSQCAQDLEEDAANWNQIAKILNVGLLSLLRLHLLL